MPRLNILPDPRLEPLAVGLQARLAQIAGLIRAENFPDVLTPLAGAALLDALRAVTNPSWLRGRAPRAHALIDGEILARTVGLVP